jgi:preprotein translocase subunit SecE
VANNLQKIIKKEARQKERTLKMKNETHERKFINNIKKEINKII